MGALVFGWDYDERGKQRGPLSRSPFTSTDVDTSILVAHPLPFIPIDTHRALARGMVILPGVLTPTEAFLAVKHGARILKLFPSQVIN